ncbi:hypothetical protein PACTADRAFT_3803 [Pachysolen tannophilus NRRL Y-2460]|uniref:DNA 3'-5' helicase n=1 Tax=Pachysolen tannophilus NRRL Y-2460 TaxID=669874 RepID=A0A1E4TT49_PACTA|nr:hypothetical protein PACTADRAFT_3803 [Pachysolen tannophilus NRRL Y-2460]
MPEKEQEEDRELELNVTPSQYDAITYPLDSNRLLKIIAGPGSGKTKTLVNRIVYLLNEGVKPNEFLVLSMTNRAVLALKNQMYELLGEEELVSQINIHTFHSFSSSVVSSNNVAKDCRIIEDIGWRTLINLSSTHSSHNTFSRLSRSQIEEIVESVNAGMTINDALVKHPGKKIDVETIKNIMTWLSNSNIITYQDLLVDCIKTVRKNPAILNNIKTVIVDEFQDMYGKLLDVVEIVSRQKNLVIAGDPNQSIYGFLGSNPNILDRIDKAFLDKQIDVIHLNECFRSTPEIMRVAEAIIDADTARIHVVKQQSYLPILNIFLTEEEEYQFIIDEIKKLVSTEVIKPIDIVILSHTNKTLDKLQHLLKTNDIQSVKLSLNQPWINSEIFHLVDYLNIIYEPEKANHSLICVLGLIEGVGPITLKTLMNKIGKINENNSNPVSIWEYLNSEEFASLMKTRTKVAKKIMDFTNEIMQIRSPENYSKIENNPDELIKILLDLGKKYGLKRLITSKKIVTEQDLVKYDNYLNQFYEYLWIIYEKSFTAKNVSQASLIEFFLKNYNDIPLAQKENSINLSTIHSAKGLEFPIVFILGADNRIYDSHELQAHRRKLYVAVTRASQLLYYGKVLNNDSFHSNALLSSNMNSEFFVDKKTLGKIFKINNYNDSNRGFNLDNIFLKNYSNNLRRQGKNFLIPNNKKFDRRMYHHKVDENKSGYHIGRRWGFQNNAFKFPNGIKIGMRFIKLHFSR